MECCNSGCPYNNVIIMEGFHSSSTYYLSVFDNVGLSIKDTIFIKAAAMIIIVLSTIRLVLEILWLIRQLHLYFADLGMCTLVETPLFIFAIIFATAVFNRECFCPRDWQWQVGIAAVFLVWVDLILYMRRMRVLGKKCTLIVRARLLG